MMCDWFEVIKAEACEPRPPAWTSDHRALRFQTPERLARWHMARAEFLCNVILPQPGERFERAVELPKFLQPRKSAFCNASKDQPPYPAKLGNVAKDSEQASFKAWALENPRLPL